MFWELVKKYVDQMPEASSEVSMFGVNVNST
jgi:hypothetical protein